MTKSSALRVAPSANGVSIWSSDIFGDTEESRLRDFLARAFSVQEVEQIELRRSQVFGRIRYGRGANPAHVLKKLGRALRSLDGEPPASLDGQICPIDAGIVYLDSAAVGRVRVSRVGAALTTWRVQHQSRHTLRLWHPFLRRRRDMVYRLEEELAAILGVEDFRASALTGRVSIRFDAGALTPDRLTVQLEKAWPRLLDGLEGPPSRTRFVAALSLAGLAFTGQYVAPTVRPIAVASVAVYSAPNVIGAARDLTHGEVGLYALYTTGLAFMLISGLPFTASVMASFMQLWPHLGRRKMVRSQRRLFAGQRRRPAWARVAAAHGEEVEVHVDDVRSGDLIVVRSGEIVPVDGVVEDGYAALANEAPLGANQLEDRSLGDAVWAGAFVRDGRLTIRAQRTDAQNVADYVSSRLPHSVIPGMPSWHEAERIANRNAKPVLALAAGSLLLTRQPRLSQALIRPDYATGPRLSAHMSTIQGVAHGLRQGVFFRNPAALDRLAFADSYVIDDSAGADRRELQVASVQTLRGISTELVVHYALTAQRALPSEQRVALAAVLSSGPTARRRLPAISRRAGVTRYHDAQGGLIELVTSQYLEAANIAVPRDFDPLPARRRSGGGAHGDPSALEISQDPALRPFWVLRDGVVIGAVSFARSGDFVGRRIIAALKRQNKRTRILYVSSRAAVETRAVAGRLGAEVLRSNCQHPARADLLRGLGGTTVWIGDGSDPNAREVIAASHVSVSVAPVPRLRYDAADVLLPARGFSGVFDAIDIGHAHAARLATDFRTVYASNLLSVAGAFLMQFGALQSGLLSNVGTALIYLRRARALDKLASAAEAERTRLSSPTLG